MRYMEGYPEAPRFYETKVVVTEKIQADSETTAIRILTARLAANGFTDAGAASAERVSPAPIVYPEYDVEVQRTVTTTAKVKAKNAPSAAMQVNQIEFPLPDLDEWEAVKGWLYIVREKGSEEILYEGDGEEIE